MRNKYIKATLVASVLAILAWLSAPAIADGGKVLADWLIVFLYQDIRGSATPALSNAGEARIYFDSGTNKLKASMNGGAYADLGGGGVAGSGTTNALPKFTAATTIGDSSLSDSGTKITGTVPMRLGPTATDADRGDLFEAFYDAPSRNIGMSATVYSNTYYALHASRRALGTAATPLAVTQDTILGSYGATGFNGTAFPTTGRGAFRICASESWTSTDNGTYLSFWTVPSGTQTTQESARFTAAGALRLGLPGTLDGSLKFSNVHNTNIITLEADTTAASYTWILPSAQGGAGTYLKNDGSGALSWDSPAAAPGGLTTQVQYNNAGAFAGDADFTFDGTSVTLGSASLLKWTTDATLGRVAAGTINLNSTADQVLQIGTTTAAFNKTNTPGVDVTIRARDANGAGVQAGGSIILQGGNRTGTGLPGTVQCPSPTSPASTVIGASAYALNASGYDVVIGDNSYTSGKYNVIIGYDSHGNTNTDSVVTLGYQAVSLGASTVAIGTSANIGSGGNNTVAVGTSTSASTDAVAIGKGATASAQYAVALGGSISTDIAEATILGSIAIGAGADAKTGNYATAIGYNASTTGVNAIAIGQGTTNTGEEAITIGKGSQATTKGSVAIGSDMYSDAQYAAVIGGPLMVHKTGSASADAATTIKFFSGAETIISTEAVSLTADIDGTNNVRTITIPSGTSFYVDEVGVILCEATVITQPTVQFGVTGTLDKFYGPAITTNLTALRKREKVVITAGGDGETSLVATMTVQGSGTGKIRFYFKGILVRDE
jgi:trimeric autotransporter adhesin